MTATSPTNDVGRFLLRAGLFLAPVAILLVFDNLLLPRGTFAFRAWEALSVESYVKELPGRFYPDQKIHRTEVGDLGHGSPWAVRKEVTWVTDHRGYRNTPGFENGADIVIVGDSMTVGTGLDQSDILASQLAHAIGKSVYAFGPSPLQGSTRVIDTEFSRPPGVVIFQRIERLIPAEAGTARDFSRIARKRTQPSASLPAEWYVRLDYLRKMVAIRAARSALDRMVNRGVIRVFGLSSFESQPAQTPQGPMLTLEGAQANAPRPSSEIEKCAQAIALHAKSLRARGIQMVFLPVPNKESVYWDFLTPATHPTFLPALVRRVRELGVPVVDTPAAMAAARAEHPDRLLYQLDDTHWNADGVAVAVRELGQVLNELERGKGSPR